MYRSFDAIPWWICITRVSNVFSHLELNVEKELVRDDIRLTVDEPEDYFVVSQIFYIRI